MNCNDLVRVKVHVKWRSRRSGCIHVGPYVTSEHLRQQRRLRINSCRHPPCSIPNQRVSGVEVIAQYRIIRQKLAPRRSELLRKTHQSLGNRLPFGKGLEQFVMGQKVPACEVVRAQVQMPFFVVFSKKGRRRERGKKLVEGGDHVGRIRDAREKRTRNSRWTRRHQRRRRGGLRCDKPRISGT